MTAEDAELEALLFNYERRLMDPVFRRDSEKVSSLLADEFREFGASGRVWDKLSILALLEGEQGFAAPEVADFAVQRLDESTALATYRTVSADQASLRSSVWVRRDGGWKMLFHQGTVCPSDAVGGSQCSD